MLAIRMQRTGRKGHAMFRVVVQDSRRTPSSGKFVALLGSYDPHAKTTTLQKEKAALYLKNGAQPSDRVAALLKREGVKLPEWVKVSPERKSTTRNPEKLRKNQPAKEKEVVTEAIPEAVAPEVEVAETPAADSSEE
jgi:small subunit ribosomal protein S16